jgi:hypothetical protein
MPVAEATSLLRPNRHRAGLVERLHLRQRGRMRRRRLLLLTGLLPATMATTSASDFRMPASLAHSPGPALDACFSGSGGLAPMHYRLTLRSGATTDWLPLDEHATQVQRGLASSMTVRDGLGRTRTVSCT